MRFGKLAIGMSIVGCAVGIFFTHGTIYQLPSGIGGYLAGAAIGALLDARRA